MTPLPKHLEEIRQSSAREYDAQEAEHLDKSEAIAYLKGFQEAASPILKDLESMAKALEREIKWREVKYCTEDGKDNLGEALKNYREKYEVKK